MYLTKKKIYVFISFNFFFLTLISSLKFSLSNYNCYRKGNAREIKTIFYKSYDMIIVSWIIYYYLSIDQTSSVN